MDYKYKMNKLVFIALILLSAQAETIRESLTSMDPELLQITTNEDAEKWSEDLEWQCYDIGEDRKCVFYDPSGDWMMLTRSGGATWWKVGEDEWILECENSTGEVYKETWPSYWEEDGDKDKAYMWDNTHRRWFVRMFACSGAVFWQEPGTCDCVPEWLWDMSGIDKQECYDSWEEGEECRENCPVYWIGDGMCDAQCLFDGCHQDAGDCDGWCAVSCNPHFLADGTCDFGCWNEECEWDMGDCDEETEGFQYCSNGCPGYFRGDGYCDIDCNVEACGYDDGDCEGQGDDEQTGTEGDWGQDEPTGPGDEWGNDDGLKYDEDGPDECAPGCPTEWMGDGFCDAHCEIEECQYDGGDCEMEESNDVNDDSSDCSPGCPITWIGDGICDGLCQTDECEQDGGDCDDEEPVTECEPGCPDWYIGDGWCDSHCLTDACQQDGGDCEDSEDCAPGCPDFWIGDDYCDPACLTDACQQDGGDCDASFLQTFARTGRKALKQKALSMRRKI